MFAGVRFGSLAAIHSTSGQTAGIGHNQSFGRSGFRVHSCADQDCCRNLDEIKCQTNDGDIERKNAKSGEVHYDQEIHGP